jgi:hypothetical protein
LSFAALAAMNNGDNYFTTEVLWDKAQSAEFPYQVVVNNQLWVIRINDFPEKAMYTLLVDGEEVIDFDNWPKGYWKKPSLK